MFSFFFEKGTPPMSDLVDITTDRQRILRRQTKQYHNRQRKKKITTDLQLFSIQSQILTFQVSVSTRNIKTELGNKKIFSILQSEINIIMCSFSLIFDHIQLLV